jgi:hypothetical protein
MDENNNNFVQEILHDLFSSLEALETQNTAILQFLKDKGIATDEELSSHLEQAGNASSVRWRGVRVRADYLFASAVKAAEQAAENESSKPAETAQKSKPDTKQGEKKETAKGGQQDAANNKLADESDHSERDQSESGQPKNDQDQKNKSEADEVSAKVKQKEEQKEEQKVKRYAEQNVEQEVAQDRNQPGDSTNKPRKNDTEKAA